MKKKLWAVLLTGAMVAAALAGCGSASEPAPAETTETPAAEVEEETAAEEGEAAETSGGGYDFVFVCPIVGMEYWNLCSDGIEKADEELGTHTQIIGPTDSSTFTTEIANYMESAIATQPDAIMAYSGLEVMAPLIEKAKEQGIPFISIDSDAPDTSRIAYIGTDPYNAGYKTGEAMVEFTGGTAKVAILCSSLSSEKEMKEVDAFKDALEGHDIEILTMEETDADLATAVVKMEALVSTYPEMTAVLGTSAYDVQAAAKVKKERGLDDLVLIGYDDLDETLNYIRDGIINGVVVQDPYNMGYQGVYLMNEFVEKGSLEEETYDTGTILVTKENVDNYRN